MLSTPVQAAAFWCALLLILMVVLAFRVIGQRRQHKVLLGDGGHESLSVAGRTFGNAAEYIPAGMAALILLAALNSSYYLIHIIGLLLFLGRIAHAAGMSPAKLTAGRMAGMILTFAAYLTAAVALLIKAFQ